MESHVISRSPAGETGRCEPGEGSVSQAPPVMSEQRAGPPSPEQGSHLGPDAPPPAALMSEDSQIGRPKPGLLILWPPTPPLENGHFPAAQTRNHWPPSFSDTHTWWARHPVSPSSWALSRSVLPAPAAFATVAATGSLQHRPLLFGLLLAPTPVREGARRARRTGSGPLPLQASPLSGHRLGEGGRSSWGHSAPRSLWLPLPCGQHLRPMTHSTSHRPEGWRLVCGALTPRVVRPVSG